MLSYSDIQRFQKLVQSESGPEQAQLLQRGYETNHFRIWNKFKHKQEDAKTKGDCCFNHIIGSLLLYVNRFITYFGHDLTECIIGEVIESIFPSTY
jgi:hypothetical protein